MLLSRSLPGRLVSLLSQLQIDPYIWLVIAFSLPALLPLAGPEYFFEAHDAPHTVFFLTEFDAALRDGVAYPGWATDQALGYGYPTFVLYPPLAYYVAEGFHLLGATKVAAIKWTWALATVGASLGMYAYARYIMGRRRGLLAAVVYTYFPYHLLDIYVRAALAEYAAFVWMPLALLAFHRLIERSSLQSIAWAGLTYGALLLTHNVTGMAFTPLLAAYILFRLMAAPSKTDRPRRAIAALGAGLLGLGIAAALLMPSFLERVYINQEQWVRTGYDYAIHFVYPFQFLSAFWGYAPAAPGPGDGMSFQLGAVPTILSIVALLGALRRPAKERALLAFYGAATLILAFLMLALSAPLWEILPIAALVQFPWRLMALVAGAMAVLSGLAIPPAWQEDLSHILVVALVAVLGSQTYTVPQYTPVPDIAESPLLTIEFERTYDDMVGMTAWTKELPTSSPMVEQYLAGDPLVTAQVLAADATMEMIRAGGASDLVRVTSPNGTALQFYTYYFPGWRVSIDGEKVPQEAIRAEGTYGLITVDVPPGEHVVLLRWGDTPVRTVGKTLTLLCLIATFASLVLGYAADRMSQKRTGDVKPQHA